MRICVFIPNVVQELGFRLCQRLGVRRSHLAHISSLGRTFASAQIQPLNHVRYKKKKALTLLEIMIVIVLIGVIGSVIGFNMKGSLDEGRAFKTRQAREHIEDILMLEVAAGATLQEVVENPEYYLQRSGLIKDGKKYLNDGWGVRFDIKIDSDSKDKLIVHSDRLIEYEEKKNRR